MQKQKKPWTTPKLKRLEPTADILALFAEQLADRQPPAEVRLKRSG